MARLISKVQEDEFTSHTSKCFDLPFDGEVFFETWDKPDAPEDFGIGLIHGPSGSGKSNLLKEFGTEENPAWDEHKAVVSHFDDPEDAVERLSAVGFNSIPSWMKPYHHLSTGEKFRVDLARKLKNNAVIDEFTSVVNRSVAKSASVAVSRYIKNKGLKNIVFATCHDDITDWLNPDWTFDTKDGSFSIGRWLQRPIIRLKFFKCGRDQWQTFARHHYLSNSLNTSAHCYLVYWDENIVGFNASLSLPNKIPPLFPDDKRNKFRESRTVVLPDYQGLGIGVRLSDSIAQHYLDQGYRYFSRTAHFRFGLHREKVDWWRATSTNLKNREKSGRTNNTEWLHWKLDKNRVCYSHEYIGKKGNKYRDLYEQHN